jgi:hypothetical protein
MKANDVRELFDYDRWANAQVLDIAARLTDEQRSRPFAASSQRCTASWAPRPARSISSSTSTRSPGRA